MDRVSTGTADRARGIAEPVPPDVPHECGTPEVVTTGIRMLPFREIKNVVKRWGQERWLHELDSPFGFKVVRILAGRRTSLQYHERKRETYFILDGDAVLHYRASIDSPDEEIPFPAGSVAHVDPGAIHRVAAVTDVVLVEASTCDDGSDNVRVEDDYGRVDGRITEEH
ncbi:cupin domain-containing protein [Actinophytocola sp.]|uniref:cupin domain-containing protein n=1 Tax=Actinophytocola sp. TaxID=1872138 RepID=UPI002ED055BC